MPARMSTWMSELGEQGSNDEVGPICRSHRIVETRW